MDDRVLKLVCAALIAISGGCRFSPHVTDGQFQCAADGSCPPSQRCGGDNRCHDAQAVGADAALGPDDLSTSPGEDLAGLDLTGADLQTVADLACVKAVCPGNPCGRMLDGCGGILDCGSKTCAGGKVCGAKQLNQCGPGTCTPAASCGALGRNCGLISNGCDDVLDCGACASGTCGGGGVANVCG